VGQCGSAGMALLESEALSVKRGSVGPGSKGFSGASVPLLLAQTGKQFGRRWWSRLQAGEFDNFLRIPYEKLAPITSGFVAGGVLK